MFKYTLLLAALLPAISFGGIKKFGKVKSSEYVVTSVAAGEGIDIQDGYKVNQLMAGFVNVSVEIPANSNISNEYVWSEKATSGSVTLNELHIQGKHRYNISVNNKWKNHFDRIIVHMPENNVDETLYDWHLTYTGQDTSDTANILYIPVGTVRSVGVRDPFYTDFCEGSYFCSFVEIGSKGRYIAMSTKLAFE